MKTLYLYILSVFFISSAYAQQTSISGLINDNQNKPLDYATVNLLKAKDSTLVKASFSDPSGKYSFVNIAEGDYLISAIMMGYKKVISKKFTLSAATPVNVETLVLVSQSNQLKEVTITTQKPFIERQADKLVVNVEGSSVSTGSTALEVLQKAPGITLDKDDNISMQGKQGVLIMLDGKPTYMSSADLANMLKNMQSDQIESIELITNPSSKYDATGKSGIINIKTKKNKNFGTNGSVVAGFGQSKNYRLNSGLTLNHRNKNINFFGNYNFNNNNAERNMVINRISSNNSEETYFGQTSLNSWSNYSNNFKAGVDYTIDSKNTLGFLATGYLTNSKNNDANNTIIGQFAGTRDSSLVSNNPANNRYSNMAYNLNYKSVLDSAGQELSADVDYSRYNGKDNISYNNYFYDRNGNTSTAPQFSKNLAPTIVDVKAFKVDYTLPLSKTTKFEAGIKSSFVKTDNNTSFTQLINNNWQNDPSRTNRFIYDENVNAAYVNANRKFKKTSVQLGLRLEQTSSKGNSINTNNIVKRSYTNLFPSLFINHELNANNTLGMSYSRRINRPQYDALNDFIFYLDKYTYNKGNPYLNPEYSNSYELSYTYKKNYSLTAGYSLTKDVMAQVLLPDSVNKALYQTNQNLAKQVNYNVALSAPIKITEEWTTQNNLNAFYMGFHSDNVAGTQLNSGKLAFQFNSNHNIKLGKTLSGELAGRYQSRMVYGTFNIRPQYSIDMGLSHSFANKQASVKLAVSDVFNTRRDIISSTITGLNYNINQKGETRIARLTFTYRFGNNNIKPERKRATGLESETNRMKN